MRVLVTGSDGYIGSVLAPFLLARGHDVLGLDTGFYRAAWLYHPPVARLPAVVNKDLRHMTVHDRRRHGRGGASGELSNDPLGQLNPSLTYAINHQGAWRWPSAAKTPACHALSTPRRVASMASAGETKYKTETSALFPQTAYAECKMLRGTRRRRPGRYSHLLAHVPAQCHGLWPVATHAL